MKRESSGSYKNDRQWSDSYITGIKRLVGPYLLTAAEPEVDMQEATDLIVLKAADMRIAARIRDVSFAEQYGGQFTIRCQRDSGSQTELDKIQQGWGDWFFYGFGDADLVIDPWYLIDLHAFRYHFSREGWQRRGIKFGQQPNGDGTHFKWFDVRSFPNNPSLLIAESEIGDDVPF